MSTSTGAREHLFDTGEVKINIAEFAGNGPPLLFIHGITSAWSAWANIIPHFTSGWRCFAMDLRGHGKSGHVPGGYHRDTYAADAAAVVRDYIKEPTYVVGHSLGATTAVGVAARVTGLVTAVVYEDPPMFVHQRPGNHGRSRFGVRLEQIKAAKSAEDLAAATREPGDSEAAALARAERWLQMDVQVLEMSVDRRAVQGWDAEGQLGKATPRALVLQANPAMGGAMTDDEAAKMAQLLPNGRLVKWEDSGHGMHAQFPQRFVETVKAFFGEQG